MNALNGREPSDSFEPALDGLRGLAVLWVFIHNGAFEPAQQLDTIVGKLMALVLNMGWLGVQLFFVLSGFLITGILIDARKRGLPNLFTRFYARRFLRIFPVYYAFLLLILLVAWLVPGVPDWMLEARQNAFWFVLYLNNWVQPFTDIGLGHFWSLAVEEQFYLFWPLVVVLLPLRWLPFVCIVMVVAAVFFRFWVLSTGHDFAESAAYVMTPARIDALAIGGMLAFLVRQNRFERYLGLGMVFTLAGAFLFMVFIVLLEKNFSRVSGGIANLNQTVAAIGFMGLIYCCLTRSEGRTASLVRAMFMFSWLRNVGRYSYAIYLFHLPISLLLHQWVSPRIWGSVETQGVLIGLMVFFADLALLFVVSYGMARISWWLIEKPCLNLKRKWPMMA